MGEEADLKTPKDYRELRKKTKNKELRTEFTEKEFEKQNDQKKIRM